MRGATNNPWGRPKGVQNRVTASVKEKIESLFENNIEKFQKDIDSLDPKDRLTIMIKLLDYVLPKQREPIEEHYERIGVDAEIPSVDEIVRKLKALEKPDADERPEIYI